MEIENHSAKALDYIYVDIYNCHRKPTKLKEVSSKKPIEKYANKKDEPKQFKLLNKSTCEI